MVGSDGGCGLCACARVGQAAAGGAEMLKAYLVGAVEDTEEGFTWTDIGFANNANEMKKLGLKKTDAGDLASQIAQDRGGNPLWYMRARRKPEADQYAGDRDDAYLLSYTDENEKIYRQFGWRYDGDDSCDTCGLYSMDGKFPVCWGCNTCEECGTKHCEVCYLCENCGHNDPSSEDYQDWQPACIDGMTPEDFAKDLEAEHEAHRLEIIATDMQMQWGEA